MSTLLTSDELATALDQLPGVQRDGTQQLRIRVKASSFAEGIALLNRVAVVADGLDHHPDIDVRYDTATYTLSTHSEGGVTELDVELARQILDLAADAGAEVTDASAP